MMDSVPPMYPPYNNQMAPAPVGNPYLPRIHGSHKPGPGRLKPAQQQGNGGQMQIPIIQNHYNQPQIQGSEYHHRRHSNGEVTSDPTINNGPTVGMGIKMGSGRYHQFQQLQHQQSHTHPNHNYQDLRHDSSTYNNQPHPPQQMFDCGSDGFENLHRNSASKTRKRREKSIERELSQVAESKKLKKMAATITKKKSKSFEESLDPLPILTLPRVELWCRDPHCQYNKYQHHSHCNNNGNNSNTNTAGRNSNASSTEKFYPGKVSRSRMSGNTVSTSISGSNSTSTTIPFPSDTTTTSLTMQSSNSSSGNSGAGSGAEADGRDRDLRDLGRSFFGFGGGGNRKSLSHMKPPQQVQVQDQSRRNSSNFEGSSKNLLQAYTQYPSQGHGHGPSSFESMTIPIPIVNDGRGSVGGTGPGNGSGPGINGLAGVTRSSRAATAFANSMAVQAMEGQCQFSSPPSAAMAMPRGPPPRPYPRCTVPTHINQLPLCPRFAQSCKHQCQQHPKNGNQLALPSPNHCEVAGGGLGGEGKMDPMSSFWHLNNNGGFHSTLKRDASFHSYGGFTLNGHPGYNKHPKNNMGRFCSSHKIALVVSTFSLFVTIGLVITLIFMKNKGMMEAM